LENLLNPFLIRRAAIGLPSTMTDANLRQQALKHFGDVPVWVICVSEHFYALVGESSHPSEVRLTACSEQGQPHDLVLVLQVAGHQLRCIASLRCAMVQRWLQAAAERPVLHLVLAHDHGTRHAAFECEVRADDIRTVMSCGVPASSSDEVRHRQTADAVFSCAEIGDVPSLSAGEPLVGMEVSVVDVSPLFDPQNTSY
jgi:hypothetical protein